jgi:hypothetical protein
MSLSIFAPQAPDDTPELATEEVDEVPCCPWPPPAIGENARSLVIWIATSLRVPDSSVVSYTHQRCETRSNHERVPTLSLSSFGSSRP